MSARSIITRWRVVSATGIICASFAWPAAAQPMVCPVPQKTLGPGVLKETSVQIAETGKALASGDGVNRVPEVVADLRKRYPGVSDAEIENYIVTAYCPEVAKLDGLSAGEQRARVDLFARQASMAVYGH